MKYFDFLDNEEENKIKRELEREENDSIHGIIVLNVDNFAVVNELCGRVMGEKMMMALADTLKEMFRGTDIVLRFRGDAFIIFTKNIKDINSIESLASKLVKTVSDTTAMDLFNLTASVGLALYPFHGRDYSVLKNKAYQAMLRARSNGKNQCRLFDSARTKALYYDYIFNREEFEKSIDAEEYFTDAIGSRYGDICMNLMKQANDAAAAMQAIIEISCLYLGFSRGYTYSKANYNESVAQRLRYANAGFEFGVLTDTRNLILNDMHDRLADQYKTFSLINVDDAELDEEVRMTLEDDGVTQILYFPVMVEGELTGACMLENLTDDLVTFTDEEFFELNNDMYRINSYYTQMQNSVFTKENLANLSMLDNMDACVYIIDVQTCRIHFANEKALRLADKKVTGELFYKVLLNSDFLPKDSPINELDPDDPHSTASGTMYNYSTREWTKSLYSWMDINDNKYKAVLVNVDVSEFFTE